jgi:quercetin dioxygenase-like cupin family protein
MQQQEAPITITRDEGKVVMFGGIGAQYKIFGEHTGGSFAVVEQPVEPRAFAPPHVHTRADEFSYVLEGELGARIGDRVVHAAPGTWIFKPRNVPHTFWNPGDTRARFIELISPPGFEKFFEEFAKLFASGPPDLEKVNELCAKYGCPLTKEEWIPELIEVYDLKPLG